MWIVDGYILVDFFNGVIIVNYFIGDLWIVFLDYNMFKGNLGKIVSN